MLFNFGGDILLSALITTVESNLRTSWSWNVICIMDWTLNKPTTVRPRFFPYHARLSYIIFNRQVVGKTTSLRQKSQQTRCYSRIATKLAKGYQSKSFVVVSNEVLIKRKTTVLQENFDFFWPNNLGCPSGMSVKFGLWTFHELPKRQKNFWLLIILVMTRYKVGVIVHFFLSGWMVHPGVNETIVRVNEISVSDFFVSSENMHLSCLFSPKHQQSWIKWRTWRILTSRLQQLATYHFRKPVVWCH